MDYSNIVDVMSGEFNCQPSISIKFLSDAKIVHFFNDKNAESDLSTLTTLKIELPVHEISLDIYDS